MKIVFTAIIEFTVVNNEITKNRRLSTILHLMDVCHVLMMHFNHSLYYMIAEHLNYLLNLIFISKLKFHAEFIKVLCSNMRILLGALSAAFIII